MATLIGKKERYTQMLYQLLKDKQELSVAQMQELLGISRKSVYNYIEELEGRSVKLQTRAQGKTKFYSIVEEAEDLGQYGAIDKNVMIVSSIVRALQKQPMSETQLVRYWEMDRQNKDGSFVDNEYVAIKATQLHNLLVALNEEGVLLWEGKNSPYYPTGKLVPPMLSYSEDEFYELQDELGSINQGHPYYKQLHSIYNKLNVICGDVADDYNETYLVQGKSYLNFQKVKAQVQKLAAANYTNKTISFDLKNKRGQVTQQYFAVGLVVYSVDKDRLYILGRKATEAGEIKKASTPIDVDNISNIKEGKGINTIFESQAYRNIYKEMFSVAIEPAERVEVEFENKFNNLAKLEQLKRQRPLAKVIVKGETIVYTDIVRGLSDFANYLRSFGKRYKVVTPLKLRNMVIRGTLRNLQMYEELENGQLL